MNSYDWKRTSCVGFLFQKANYASLCMFERIKIIGTAPYKSILRNLRQPALIPPLTPVHALLMTQTGTFTWIMMQTPFACIDEYCICVLFHITPQTTRQHRINDWHGWIGLPCVALWGRLHITPWNTDTHQNPSTVYRIPRIGESALNKGE